MRAGKYEYTPFGGKYADHGDEISRKFTGHDWDADARLYYTAYRYYSPDSNRWLTRDPLGMVDGPNVYAYVVNNPVSLWDALGQCGVNAQTAPGDGNGGWADAINATVLAILAIIAVAGFIYKYSKKNWKNTSVGHSLMICAATLIAYADAILASYLLTGLSRTTQNVIRGLGVFAGAACIGFWALFNLEGPFVVAATGNAKLGIFFGDTVFGYALAAGTTTGTVGNAIYEIVKALTE